MRETNAKRSDPNPRRVRQGAPPASAEGVRGAAGDPIAGADGTTAAAGHLPTEVMANLMIAPGGSDEGNALRHLLSVCPTCRGQHEDLKAKRRELRHWNLAAVLVEADEAPGLWNQIAALPYQRQLAAVRAEPSYQTWGFALLVLRLSGGSAAAEPKRAAQLANLGLAVAEALGPAYDQAWIEDLAALALACLGDARREMGELAAANDAFDQARERRAAGTEGPSIEAEILSLEALLRRDERRLEAAIGLLGRVHEICTEQDETEEDAYDPHLGGAALVHQAWCLYHLGRKDAALTTLDGAEGLLQTDREPSLLLALRSGRVRGLLSLGQLDAAAARLGEALQLAEALGERPAALRLRIAEARMTTEREAAERILREAAEGFLVLELGVDAALAFMELAALFVDDSEKVRPLGNELLPVWSCAEIERYESAALMLFQQACEERRLTADLVRQLAAFLERQRRPSLAWWSAWDAVLHEGESPWPPEAPQAGAEPQGGS
jgi:hypothetical protein